jgi:outer membrane protein TolC
MKAIILSFAAMILCRSVFSQNPPNRPSTSKNSSAPFPYNPDSATDIRERLVQLAWQNPSAEVDDHNTAIAVFGLKKARSNILNQISVQGNLNEFSISKSSPYGNLYPKYNVGVNVPLGLFTTRSHDVDIARESVGVAISQKNDHYRTLKAAVLSKYEDYLMDKQLVDLQRQLAEDVHSDFLKAEQDYASARIKVDEYNRAYREYNLENTKLITLQRNLNVDVLEIEKYIGVKFDDVLNTYR